MSSERNIDDLLEHGIRAARAGDKETARRLLKQVIDEDPDNELALIWLASSVTSPAERRMYLQQVVRVNPDNQRAREALRQLSTGRSENVPYVASQISSERPAAARPTQQADSSTGSGLRLSPVEILLIVVLAVLIGVAFVAISGIAEQQANTAQVAVNSPTPVTPSNTPEPTDPVDIVVVTRIPPTFPPTFTPTATPTETRTPTPTHTPFPIAEFQMMLVERNPNDAVPILFRADGMADNPQLIEGNTFDVTYDLSGRNLALVKQVTYDGPEGGEASTVTEIFVAPSDNPSAARQVTETRIADAHSPTFSPEGNQLIFVSDFDGDDELWLLDIASGNVLQLTDNEVSDRDPDWSPDGTRVIFASDRDFSRQSEIYMLEFVIQQDGAQRLGDESPNIITQMTDNQGNSYQPKWSDDGEWIVYVNDAEGDGDIYLMDKNGQRGQVLTINDRGAEDKSPSFTPDRRYVSFISNREDERFQAYLVTFNGREVIRLTETENIAEAVDFRPMLIFRVQTN